MNIEKALAIEGGMNPLELEWLAEKASRCNQIVEIGSLRGRSAMGMADNMMVDSTLWCVDHFKGSEEHGDAWSRDDNLYNLFCDNLKDHIYSGRVVPVRLSSIEAANLFLQVRKEQKKKYPSLDTADFDMVFIDASHDYASVKSDILNWRYLLKPGGLLCGHDYGHPPIEKVVRELFPNNHRPVPGGSIWEVL
jgi:SAM-dependent methyltransferase